MSSRNTEVLRPIIQTLDGLLISEPHALVRLEIFFKDSLLLVAGNETDVAEHAEHLRLAIIEEERGPVPEAIVGRAPRKRMLTMAAKAREVIGQQ
jgi:hypothetical protein